MLKKLLVNFYRYVQLHVIPCFIPGKKARRHYRAKQRMAKLKQDRQKIYLGVKQTWQDMQLEKLIPARFVEYDLVFSIGANCAMTFILIAHKLRLFSNPFDWTDAVPPVGWLDIPGCERDTRFREKIDALCEDFEGYLNPADLKPHSFSVFSREHVLLANTRNHIRFPHLFDVDKSLEQQMPNICAKIDRRAKHLLNEISGAKRILICWGHRMGDLITFLESPVSDEDIKYAVQQLNKKWPDKEFDIVFFEHDGAKNEFEYDKIHVCGGAYRIRSNHFIYNDSYLCKYPYDVKNKYRRPHLVVAECLDNIRLTGIDMAAEV